MKREIELGCRVIIKKTGRTAIVTCCQRGHKKSSLICICNDGRSYRAKELDLITDDQFIIDELQPKQQYLIQSTIFFSHYHFYGTLEEAIQYARSNLDNVCSSYRIYDQKNVPVAQVKYNTHT